MRLHPVLAFAVAALALVCAPPATLAQEEVRDTVDVREAALLVELPAGVEPSQARERLEVRELGVERQVTQVEALAGQWRVRVEIDPGLCDPESKRAALVALAAEAERWVELGAVEIAVAGPPAEIRLAPTRDPGAVERALLEEAGRGPCEERPLARIGAALERLAAGAEPAAVRADLWDGLARAARAKADAALAEPCAGGACLLVWVGSGGALRPDLAAPGELRGPESEAAGVAIESARRDLAEGLGVQGWRVLALADFGAARVAPSGPSAPGARGTEPPPPGRIFPSQPWLERQIGPGPEGYERYLDLQLAVLRFLASRTAGALIDDAANLARRLAEARRFARVWIRTDSPRDGRAHEVAVALAGRGGPRPLTASTWLVTGESEALAAARARAGR